MASNYLAKGLKRSALAVALSLCFAGGVQAQSTTGNIYGSVPAGSTVTITNDSGLTRTVTADANGRYTANNLPIGNYTVVSGSDRRTLVVTVGSSSNVSFGGAGGATQLGVVTVTGNSVPSIDVTQTDTRTVVTAEELRRIPVPRSAESIALMAPGAVEGNGRFFGGQITFGGSSAAENAYYLNGYFSGNPMTNVGGFTLPYGSIDQQETYTGGYAAKYGRSSGGVISQIGKSGTNDWHFGGQIVWTPKSLREVRPDRYYPDLSGTFPTTPFGTYRYASSSLPGQQIDSGQDRKSWSTVYSAYVGGPIIRDRLFFFLSGEYTDGNSVTPGGNPGVGQPATGFKNGTQESKLYLKVNWNITDNHFLEYTYVNDYYDRTGTVYNFNWSTYSFGSAVGDDDAIKDNTEFSILKYTGYLTDNLTLSATYGRSRHMYNVDPLITGNSLITGAPSQNPLYNGGTPITNTQPNNQGVSNAKNYTDGLRVELEWLIGDHTLTLGYDKTTLRGENEGITQYANQWNYGQNAGEFADTDPTLGVGPTGTVPGACNGAPLNDNSDGSSSNCGYWVSREIYHDTASMHNVQTAWYIEDKWQIASNLMLSIGVRADAFENYSGSGQLFVDSGVQWQPRLGFAWDVNGDSSFKVFGNAGRYFLSMPNAVAIRGVGASTFTSEYFTYTGIDPSGNPTGTTPIGVPGSPGTPAGPVSSNGEYGTPKDPALYVPSDIKSQYQDEYVLGFEHTLGQNWTLGAKLTRRVLKSAIDDMCDAYGLPAAAGLTPLGADLGNAGVISQDTTSGKYYLSSFCYMFNPGGSNTYRFQEVTGVTATPAGTYLSTKVPGSTLDQEIAASALGMPPLKRTYSALDFFVERKWDGKWGARLDYTYSRSHGNSEGPANSDTSQGSDPHDNGVATSVNWDNSYIMAYAAGFLPNDRRHQLKVHGAYAINDEWMVSANIRVASGAPLNCFGRFDPDGSINHSTGAADPAGYGDWYHTCFGDTWTPGKKTSPWTQRFDLGVTYKPAYFDHKLALNVNVFNLFNQTVMTSWSSKSEQRGYVIRNAFGLPTSYTTPRYVQISLSYDY